MSAETKAIIDRLKQEGDLIRNSGTNSVRSVRLQLDRFEGIFNTISSNIVEQTELMRLQVGAMADQVERARTQAQFDEINKPPPARESSSNDSDNSDASNEAANRKIDSMGDKITGALNMKNLAMAGAGLFVGYNLLKGYIDETTNGGWSAMEETIKTTAWPALKSGIGSMIAGIALIDWTTLAEAINTAANAMTNFGTWVSENLAGIIQAAVIGRIAAHTAGGAARGAFSSGGMIGNMDASDRRLINRGQRHRIRLGIAGIVTTGLLLFGNSAKNWVEKQEFADNEIAGMRVGDLAAAGIDAATVIGTAATIGGMFGPAGLIAGAAVGTAWVVGSAIYNWQKRREAETVAGVERRLADFDAIFGEGTGTNEPGSAAKTLDEITGGLIASLPAASTQEVGYNAERMGYVDPSVLALAATGDPNAIAQVEEGIRRTVQDMTTERFAQIGAEGHGMLESILDTTGTSDFDSAGNIQFLQNLMSAAAEGDVAVSSQARNFIQRLQSTFNSYNESDLAEVTPGERAFIELLRDALKPVADDSLKTLGTTKRRPGDHHPPLGATVSPISYNPMRDGRLIIYDEFGNPHFLTNQEQNGALGALLRDGTIGSGGVVINNITPVSAPQSFNITEGNKNVAMTKIGSGGGFGGSVMREIGLTHFAV